MFFKINFTRHSGFWIYTKHCEVVVKIKTIYIKSAVLLHNDEEDQNIEMKFILFHDLACDREMTEIVAICFIHYIILNSQRLCETNVNI